MPFKKGQPRPANAGRKRGSVNKINHDAKAEILKVFDYLQKNPATSLRGVAKGKPDWFYESIYKAVVPRETKADVTHDLSGNLMSLAVQVAQELRLNSNGNGDNK